MALLSRLLNVFRSDRVAGEIDEELHSHLEEAAAQGRDPLEARRALGSPLRLREESRDTRVIAWLDSLRVDLVFAWRQLGKRKVTSLAAILSLGLAIGACLSAFRIIDALFFRPLPISHPERLYALTFHGTDVNGKVDISDACNYPLFRQMTAAAGDDTDLLAIGYSGSWSVTYGSDQDMERAYGAMVSARMFALFGLRPAVGRLLTSDDDAPGRAYAVLSFDYWTRRFGRDPKVAGQTFRFGRDLYTIVGVAQKGFTGVEPGTLADMFVPVMMNHDANNPDFQWFRTLAVVKPGNAKPGVAVERVRDRIQGAVRAFWQERVKAHPGLPKEAADAIINQKAVLEPAYSGVSGMQRNYRQALISLAILVALVLLIACANVANLMTAQAAARAREMALRVSIGAGPLRLAQLVLVESALLAIFAAVAGAAFAWWSAPFVVASINRPDRPASLIFSADWRVLAFAFVLTLIVMFLYGLAPALRASSVKPASALKGGEDPHARRRLMHTLIAAQTAFCFLVLFAAGLFAATFARLLSQPLGFSPDRLLALDVAARDAQPPSAWNRVLEGLRAAPGVEKAATAMMPLLIGSSWDNFVALKDDKPNARDVSDFLSVSPGWMETMKIPLLAGRDLREGEAYPGVAIVNQAFAELFFKEDNVVGKSFQTPEEDPNTPLAKHTIVGLVGNARYANLRGDMPPVAYVPFRSQPNQGITVMVRTASRSPLALVPTLRRAISAAAPGLRVSGVNTQQEFIDEQTIRERLLAMLALFFAVVALLLAGVGIFGVLDYSVFQRRREIGIRMAIGAQAPHIIRGVTFEILGWVLAGGVAGVAGGIASARYIESLLYGVKPTDVAALATPAGALLATAILASLAPVIRAVRIDPVYVLRSE
jgi:putative ABC transport system permease protein